MSEHFERALADWREARAAFETYMLAEYEKAAEACRDALVNADGRRLGIDPLSLFMGRWARARRYASEELLEYWREHERVPFVEFERRWIRDQEDAHDYDVRSRVMPWGEGEVAF